MSGSQWRIDRADNISAFCDANAIVLVGSPALGLADAYTNSDMTPESHKRTMQGRDTRMKKKLH